MLVLVVGVLGLMLSGTNADCESQDLGQTGSLFAWGLALWVVCLVTSVAVAVWASIRRDEAAASARHRWIALVVFGLVALAPVCWFVWWVAVGLNCGM